MRRTFQLWVLIHFLLLAVSAHADDLKQCSTEKINNDDCVVIVDRRYPITLPTIQMKPGKKVIVKVQDPLSFETLSLDETTATALPGSDQGASLLTAAAPNLKGFVWSNVTVPGEQYYTLQKSPELQADQAESARYDALQDIFKVMREMLDAAQNAAPDDRSPLFTHIVVVYNQINQVLSPIPKPGSKTADTYRPPPNAPGTPNPWNNYQNWRLWILCELVGGKIDGVDCATFTVGTPPTAPAFNDVLSDISKVQNRLPTTPPAAPPDDPLFDQGSFSSLVRQAKAQIAQLSNEADKARANEVLKRLLSRQNDLNSRLAALASTLTNVQKDFLTYYQNIYLAKDIAPVTTKDKNNNPVPPTIGIIYDPKDPNSTSHLVAYRKLLGRQVVFAINTVNNIATPVNSVTPTSAKIPIATVTVLYADPHFETSAGVIFSFVHNRSFSNQTVTRPPPGSNAQPGDIVIFESKTYPEVVPIVAAHYRLGPEYAPSWLGNRRVAFYATGTLGLNPYSVVPEFGGGPTISWRSFMVSALYNRAHESALTSGLNVGQIVCSPSSTGTSPPPCTPAPPAPTTHVRGLNAFAIGLTIRIPTSFAAGTGGVSR
jgi:hypothetical protein